MREIQDTALRLFEANDYRSVSVERVAAAAGVSPSTVYRYFGTKEMLVVWDDFDPQILQILREQGDGVLSVADYTTGIGAAAKLLVAALIAAGDEEKIKQRMRLVHSEADVRAGELRQIEKLETQIRDITAARLGRSPDGLDMRLLAAEGAWGILAAIDYWVVSGFAEPLGDVLNKAIDVINRIIEVVLDPELFVTAPSDQD